MSTATRENDLFHLLCGREIGEGSARRVYEHAQDPALVVKEEVSGFQNVLEWETWRKIEKTPFAKWFAPCVTISNNGLFLIMKRTTPVNPKKLPDKMPRFLCDFKYQNYGILDGKLVCHDYGLSLLMEYGMTRKMIKVNWWDGANYR